MRNTASLLRRFVFVTIAVAAFIPSSGAQEPDLTARARQALIVLFDALRSGEVNQVEPLLAPEFQVIRSDGGAYNKQQYLQHSLPKIQRPPRFDDLVVTQNADIVVTRMKLHIEGQIDGKQAESGAPQLIVFRITPRGWEVVATANFARLMSEPVKQ